ncbi:hypothetical protein [uncultured Stenotrophomonas sp.]|uniref:hypothetical protein n=1 Tax=uncultured Stenotrophomonas sp. TaxID=165438 RepID=UPI0025FA9445|nr:hypothetical protein [uncultured Stenotrophomonas sp.]
MDTSNTTRLSFAALDQRLREMPEGAAGVLNTPPFLKFLNAIAFVGAMVGATPYFLIKWLEPTDWMVWMARSGLVVLVVAGLPDFIRNCGVLGLRFWRWRDDQVRQLDHDREYFEYILDWLARFPETELNENERVARLSLTQLTAKIGLIAGGLDKLGVLPVVVSAFLFIRQWSNPLAMPAWQAILSAFLVLLYFIAANSNLMRIRLQLCHSLLVEAGKRKVLSLGKADIPSVGVRLSGHRP